jgi:2-(1,2-epoxy-1,2-dihydrophenyl)acetyl-CoA isomerase
VAQDLIQTVEDGIATLTLNRPEARNALTPTMLSDLAVALQRLALDASVRVVVVTGAGRAFCAGGDVKAMAAAHADGSMPSFDERVASLRARSEAARWLHEMPKPTLAVIPGPAAGAGLSIALACDLRIAADDAKLTTAFSKVGVSGDFGGSYFLSQLVGASRARELYFTARIVGAEEALRLGMVDRVAPAAEIEAAGRAYARELAALPTVAVGYMKRNLNIAQRGSLADVLDAEAIHMTRTRDTEDHKAAARAFVEKRTPTFSGR